MGPVAGALTIPGVLERGVAAHPSGTAIVAGLGARLTYEELGDRVRVAARALLDLGVEAGARVALWAPNSPDWVVASFASASIGAALVPLNTRWHLSEVLEVVERADCAAWLVADEFLGTPMAGPARDAWNGPVVALRGEPGREAAGASGEPTWDDLLDRRDLPPDAALDARLRALTPDTISHVQFTSGTTGRPKGVVLAHGPMVSTTLAWAGIVGLGPTDRSPVVSPMSHIGGHKTGTLAAVVAGAASLPVARFDAVALLDLVEAEGVTVLQGPPTMFASLLDVVDATGRPPRTLRVAVTGSAVIPPALLRRMFDTLGLEQVHAGYGLTEATGVCTITRADDPLDLVAESSGRPVDGVDVRIVDGDHETLPAGERGQILVRGPGVMRGYLDDPDATRDAILTIPEAGAGPGGRWLATGDVGWVDTAGNLRIVDRITDMIIVGGFNTSPAEIERVIEAHPAVAQVAVVGVPHPRLGEAPAAFVVAAAGAVPDEVALLAWATERLANYKVPRHVWFVDELPLNAVAKIDKVALAERSRALLAG
jgi:HIP---CoA ligase